MPKEKPAYDIGAMPSLKNFKPEVKKEEPKPDAEGTLNLVNEPATTTKLSFEDAWLAYIKDLQNRSKKSLSIQLEKLKPTVANNSFTIDAANKIVADMIEEEKSDLLIFLRRRTGNVTLNMEINILQQTDNDIIPYTNEEKFKSLAQKNPKLLDLRNALGLEIE